MHGPGAIDGIQVVLQNTMHGSLSILGQPYVVHIALSVRKRLGGNNAAQFGEPDHYFRNTVNGLRPIRQAQR